MKLSTKINLSLLTLILSIFLLTSCGDNKITKENYDKIENGMTLEEVEKILGKGEANAETSTDLSSVGMGKVTASVYSWQDGSNVITMTFSNNKLEAKGQSGL